VAAALIVVGTLLPEGSWWQAGAEVLVGYLAAGAILAGVRRHRPAVRAAWWCFALGVFGNASGILIEAYNAKVRGVEAFPSVADVGYLSLYPAFAVGLMLLVRRRAGRDWGAVVDTTTITTGLGLLAWVFMIRPAVGDASLTMSGRIVSIAYPIADIVLVAVLVRLQVGAGTKPAAYWLVTASLGGFLAGDAAWAVVNAMGWEPGPVPHRILTAVYLCAYSLFGLAGQHPSVRELGERTDPRPPRLSGGLLVLLTVASLIAPVLLVVQVVGRQVTDGLAIAVGCIVLFLLVVTRMAQLLRQLEAQTRRIRELTRIDELTGLPNRRAWGAELPAAVERARRDRTPLAVAMLDLDHFKRFNDQYGHPAGDRMLKSAAAAWRDQLRSVDYLARYGGEEFIVLLPQADAGVATEVLERLRKATPLGQTFSAGLAAWNGVETSDELVARADAALYAAKRGGRDRVEHAVPADWATLPAR
jgi:diguanylate cyclase (GGDEF)-like protein